MNYKKIMKKIDTIIETNTESKEILDKIVKTLYENINHYDWIGIYIVENDKLILGPWQGKQATEHTNIPIGKGVCGSAASTGNTEIVPDVKKDERYLSCFISTKSEIVVPIKKGDFIVAEVDVDSDERDVFSEEDKMFLEDIAKKVGGFF